MTDWVHVLGIRPGITAFIGGGGKTGTLLRAAGALPGRATVCTTTRMQVPDMPLYTGTDLSALRRMAEAGPVCIGTVGEDGKLHAPQIPVERLTEAVDYVLCEADGARMLPLKAHADHEPVIPRGARVILVAGTDGLGRKMEEVCHRPELYGRLSGLAPEDRVTPEAAAAVMRKEGYGDLLFLTKAETLGRQRAALHLAALAGMPAVIGSLWRDSAYSLAMEGGTIPLPGFGRRPRVLIRGAGDIASGIALRLFGSGMDVCMTEVAFPLTVRRTVAFSGAVRAGETTVEGVRAVRAETAGDAERLMARRVIPVLVDPACVCRTALQPDVLVDAILAKRNLGTRLTDAPVVIGVGPGFTAGQDCHAAVETMRGHTLGRVIYTGSPLPNTAIPGLIGGFAGERVLRAPADGVFRTLHKIGDSVQAGDVAATVAGQPVTCMLTGVLRGLMEDGTVVTRGLKVGDVDPRCKPEYCETASDKALAVGGGVLEAALHFLNQMEWTSG